MIHLLNGKDDTHALREWSARVYLQVGTHSIWFLMDSAAGYNIKGYQNIIIIMTPKSLGVNASTTTLTVAIYKGIKLAKTKHTKNFTNWRWF